jgi:hypothetical protein
MGASRRMLLIAASTDCVELSPVSSRARFLTTGGYPGVFWSLVFARPCSYAELIH